MQGLFGRTSKIETGFKPTDIGGCVLWLRSDIAWKDAAKTQPCVSDADLIYVGEDKSGLGHDVIQATSGARPKFYTNQINSIYPAWRFDGIDDFLKAVAFTWNLPEVVYVVFKPLVYTYNVRVFDGNAFNSMGFFAESGATNDAYKMYYAQANYSNYSIDLPDPLWVIARLRYTADSGCGLRKNNESEVANPNSGINNAQGFILGSPDGTQFFSNIDVAEICGYNAVPSTGDDTKIMNYINTRYAIY